VKARARVVAGPGGPCTASVLRSDLPIVLRPADDAVWLAQGAAGPLNGDDVELCVEVPDGCALRLRAVASTLVLPSLAGGVARIAVRATVGAGASLELLLEPVVVADGGRVELVTEIALAADARLLWREEVVLGRYGERGGEAATRIDVMRGGKALLRNGFHVSGADPTTSGPSMLGPGRAVGSLLAVGSSLLDQPPGATSATLTLADGSTLVTAVAASAVALRRVLDRSAGQGHRPLVAGPLLA
jgi:urease accessory protein